MEKQQILDRLKQLKNDLDFIKNNATIKYEPLKPTIPSKKTFIKNKKPNFFNSDGLILFLTISIIPTLYLQWLILSKISFAKTIIIVLFATLLLKLYYYFKDLNQFETIENINKKNNIQYNNELKNYNYELSIFPSKYEEFINYTNKKNKIVLEIDRLLDILEHKFGGTPLYRLKYWDKKPSYGRISRVRYIDNDLTENLNENENTTTILESVLLLYKKELSEIELRNDITDDEKIAQIIKIYGSICAAIAIQPIPFADIFILTPIQILMGKKIAAIRGYELLNEKSNNILKEISGAIGLGLIAQQLAIGAYKSFIPFLGAITTIPMVFGLTFGIGKVMDYYILAKLTGQIPSKTDMKRIYTSSKVEGEKLGKENAEKINKKIE